MEEYHPYGSTSWHARTTGEVSAKRYRYTGKEKDDETGLYYHGARQYAAWLGRWTAADPSGTKDGVNRYAYCRGSPVRFHDPNGRGAAEVLVTIVIADAVTPEPTDLVVVPKVAAYGLLLSFFALYAKVSLQGQETLLVPAMDGAEPAETTDPDIDGDSDLEPDVDEKSEAPSPMEETQFDQPTNAAYRTDAQGNNWEQQNDGTWQMNFHARGASGGLGDISSGDPTVVAAGGGAGKGSTGGDKKTILRKLGRARAGDTSAAAEIGVARLLSDEGKDVLFVAEDPTQKTPDFTVNGRRTEVKRIAGLGSNAAGDLAKGVQQVGAGGEIIVVRPAGAVQSHGQYQDFVDKFTPKEPGVTFRVIDEDRV